MSSEEVSEGRRSWHLLAGDCLDWMKDKPANCVDLIFGSPPYAEKGERYQGGRTRWKMPDWIDWMLKVTTEAVRLSKGYVLWVANGAVRQGRYLPACEGLIWKAHERGILCERPCIWHKNAPPNRRDWFGNDWEYVLAFKSEAKGNYFDWETVAASPRFTSGGHFRQRDVNGRRRRGGEYPKNTLARPRDVVRATVGGGHLGHPLAHENEAPFPEKLADYFVRSCCPVGGIVLDPFSGSATTGAVALKTGCRFIGIDVRQSQVDLGERRLAEVVDGQVRQIQSVEQVVAQSP